MSYYIQVYIIIKISCILFCTMTSGMYRSTSYKCFHVQRQTTVQEKYKFLSNETVAQMAS